MSLTQELAVGPDAGRRRIMQAGTLEYMPLRVTGVGWDEDKENVLGDAGPYSN
jgi:hypothetical protein